MHGKNKIKRICTLLFVMVAAVYYFVFEYVLPQFNSAKVYTKNNAGAILENTENIYVHFIDVGQGDSTLVQTAGGKFVLIDAGTNDCEHELLSYLDSKNVEYIDCLILTHPHEDHIGSADAVMDSYYVCNVVKTDVDDGCINCDNLERAIKESQKHIDTNVVVPENGDVFDVDGVEFTILSDGRGYKDLNDTSLCFRMDYGKSSFLFTGDAQKTVEYDILLADADVSAQVYKCGHHGSSTSNCEEFLSEVSADIAVISCGDDNMYGHPHDEVVDRLLDRNVEIFRTDVHEDIVLCCSKDAIALVLPVID